MAAPKDKTYAKTRTKSITKRGPTLPWRKDPITLSRLVEVQRLLVEDDATVTDMCRILGVSWSTLRRDMGRLQELWLEEVGEDVKSMRLEALANYLFLQQQTLTEYGKTHELQSLRLAMDINGRIVDLLGLAVPPRVELDTTVRMTWGLSEEKELE